jgi:hypothetical protein
MSRSTPLQTAAAETAPVIEREVFARDVFGGAKRISLSVADDLVERALADRVSAAGHVRLKLGIKIEKLDAFRGAAPSVTTIGRRDRKEAHPRCMDWRRQA